LFQIFAEAKRNKKGYSKNFREQNGTNRGIPKISEAKRIKQRYAKTSQEQRGTNRG